MAVPGLRSNLGLEQHLLGLEAPAARCCCPRDEAVLSPESVADVEGGTAEAPAVVAVRAPCCLEGMDGAGC